MNIDDYLARMSSDLDKSLSDLGSFLDDDKVGNDTSGHEEQDRKFCPECGTELPADAKFCFNCGCKIDEDEWKDRPSDSNGDAEEAPSGHLQGIIMTNTVSLSEKYAVDNAFVSNAINNFISQSADNGMKWYLLDTANYGDVLGQNPTWLDFNNLISHFIEEKKLKQGPDLHLFIIGGDDVVVIPKVDDPYEHGSGSIPTDTPYCFDGNFIPAFIQGSISDLQIADARNNVARLPLEDGKMETKLQDDLLSYFKRCNDFANGLPVGNVVMESHKEWIPASTTMTEHLPLLYSTDDPELIKNGMYISPKLLTSDDKAMSIYKKSLAKADMLMFNLHGADSPDMPSFYSDDEAFSPDELTCSHAHVLNTVACFGARYAGGYSRKQSMLLQALYIGDVLLYTGSLVSVPMYRDSNNENRELARQLLLNPGTGSEVFMRLYPIYQFNGTTAGKALLQAKCDYFNLCRHVESDTFALSTMLMFCLYGNPMLHVKKQERVVDAALANDAVPPAPVKSCGMPVRRATVKTIMAKEQLQKPKSILDQARGAVDENLRLICNQIADHLYKALGLPQRYLVTVDEIKRQKGMKTERRYSFAYHNPNVSYGADTFVEVDESGEPKRVYSTK